MEASEQLTSGQAARILGCSRQHVVDLCDTGRLPCSVIGSHRRIARADLRSFIDRGRALRREEERSLWLHRALLGPLLGDPDTVLARARANITRWRGAHRADGMTQAWLSEWDRLLDAGVDEVSEVLGSRTPRAVELRSNSPFAGVLSEDERLALLQSFQRHWARDHAGA